MTVRSIPPAALVASTVAKASVGTVAVPPQRSAGQQSRHDGLKTRLLAKAGRALGDGRSKPAPLRETEWAQPLDRPGALRAGLRPYGRKPCPDCTPDATGNRTIPLRPVAPRKGVRLPALLALLVAVVAAAPTARAGDRPLRVVTSFYPLYVMTLNIVGDTPGVTVECLTQSFVGCLHDYQLTPGNLVLLSRADLLVANGAGMETFLDKAARQCPGLRIIEATQGLRLASDGNPHLWVSVSGAIEETGVIARGLAAVDAAHASAYSNNAANYLAKLDGLRAKMHAALDHLADRNIITFHEAFPYFASEFNLNIVGVVERQPGSEPNARELADTIKLVRDRGVRAVFAEPQYPAKSAGIIQRETGVLVRTLDPAATGDLDPATARDSYLRTMEHNLQVLGAALADETSATPTSP